jgi:hypothetical protein
MQKGMSEAPVDRIHHHIAVDHALAVGLFVLAVPAGVTAAATGTSDASASGALHGSVTIVVARKPLVPKTVAARGRFWIIGAISDRGKFVDRGRDIWSRTLVGSKGTVWITIGEAVPGSPCQCNWRITKGTKAYAGLRGRGRELGSYTSSIVAITMSGTVSQ